MTKDGTGPPLSTNVWDIKNELSDFIAPIFHFVVWGIVIIMIEKKFFAWMRIPVNKEISNEAKQLDDDVQREVERVKINEQSSVDSSAV